MEAVMFFGLKDLGPLSFFSNSNGCLPDAANNKSVMTHYMEGKYSGSDILSVLCAASYGNGEMNKFVYEKNRPDYKIKDENGNTLGYAALYASLTQNTNHSVEAAKTLISLGIHPETLSADGKRLIDGLIEEKNRRLFPERIMIASVASLLGRGIVPSLEIYNGNKDFCAKALRDLGGTHAISKLEKSDYGFKTFKTVVKGLQEKERQVS